jgi:hypothetical protein
MSLTCPHCGKGVTLRLAASSFAPAVEPQIPSGIEPQPTVIEPQNGGVEPQLRTVEPQVPVVEGVRTSKSRAKYYYPDPNFQAFWKVYPRRVGKASAFAKWRIAVREVEPQTLIAAAESFAASMKGTEPQYIPYPEKWLAHGRWEDEDPAIVDNTPRETDFIAESDAEYERILDLLEKGELS